MTIFIDEVRRTTALRPRRPRGPDSSARILLVAGRPDRRRTLIDHLRRQVLEVESADDGRAALEKALAGDFDLIILDVRMPGPDGFDAARSLRRAGFGRPIIALTARAAAEDRERSRRAGCTDCLIEPFEFDALDALLSRHLPRDSRPFRAGAPSPSPGPAAADRPIVSKYWGLLGMDSLIRSFVDSLPEKVSRFKACLDSGAILAVESLAHQVRGVGSSYGYACLTETASLIEQAAREGQDAELLSELVEEFAALSMNIRRGLARPR